jgi:hypothetical protein
MQARADGNERTASSSPIDASPSRRPGIPQRRAPAPAGQPHWIHPAMQAVPTGVIKDRQKRWTATFGTGQPPKGLSGAMRRFAYDIPDYRIRRWLLLMIADRVDTLEWRMSQPAARASVGVVLAAGGLIALAMIARRHAR